MRLAFATPEEIQELSADVSETYVRHTLTGWQFVVMHVTQGGSPLRSARLFGWADDIGESWSTSNVTGIDLSTGLVRTANSTYAIAGPRARQLLGLALFSLIQPLALALRTVSPSNRNDGCKS